MHRITNKRQMYRLLKAGTLGNTVRHWDTLDAMVADPYDGPCGARCTDVGRPLYLYRMPKAELVAAVRDRNLQAGELEFYESPLDDHRTIQGEIMRGPWGLHFRYTFAPGAMRLALREQELHAHGLEADHTLRKHCDPCCYDWVMHLLDEYDSHVVEFTSYDTNVGTLNIPYIIWEVRYY